MANWAEWLEGVSVTWIIVLGVFLFFFPEPISSVVGAILLGIGVVAFFVGWWEDRQADSTT
ncbi:hypothetical protein DMJ13_19675 [halophilic archaeon]|nr:hypothetical protein DMJ13_19675 [halophilic archaeon]